MRNVANIVIARIARRELAASFDTWVYTIAAEKARQAAHADRRRKMLASLRHMQNSNLFAAFHGWNENIKTLRKQRIVILRAVRKMIKRELAISFGAWLAWLESTKIS